IGWSACCAGPGSAQGPAVPAAPRAILLAPVPTPDALPAAPTAPAVVSGTGELSVDALVEQVLARNPSLAQMVAAWQAAQARYPQVTSLEDPMFAGTLGPATYGSNTVDPAYRLEISQKY